VFRRSLAQPLEGAREVFRQRLGEAAELVRRRVRERELARVQEEPREPGAPRELARLADAPALARVAEHRVPEVREVRADLVRAARFDLDAEERRASEAPLDAPVRDGVLPGLARADLLEAVL